MEEGEGGCSYWNSGSVWGSIEEGDGEMWERGK